MKKYLEIAAGRLKSDEWVGIRDVPTKDPAVMQYDMTDLPMKGIADNTFEGVYSEHFIEHIYKYQGIDFLKEMFRILKSGGVIRTIWPPYEFVEKLVSNEKLTDSEEYFVKRYYDFYIRKKNFAPQGFTHKSKREQCALGLLHQEGEHRCVWSIKDLKQELKNAGFINVKEQGYQESDFTPFKNLELKCEIRKAHSAVVEAVKP